MQKVLFKTCSQLQILAWKGFWKLKTKNGNARSVDICYVCIGGVPYLRGRKCFFPKGEKVMKSITTSEKAAVTRAIEMLYPKDERLYEDPYSIKFITPFNRFFLKIMKSKSIRDWMMNLMEKAGPGIYGGIISRTRYMDDILEAAISNKFDAVVNLGGGYDTKCLRFNFRDVTYYHVDKGAVIDSYKRIVGDLQDGIPSHNRFVPIDFNTQSIETELLKSGFSKEKKTLFLWEGVTQYITEEAVTDTLKYISSCLSGSQIVFTYVPKRVFTDPDDFSEYQFTIKTVRRTGEEWVTGFDPENMETFVKKHGLSLIEDVGATEYQERYFRPTGRVMTIMPIERIVFAEVT